MSVRRAAVSLPCSRAATSLSSAPMSAMSRAACGCPGSDGCRSYGVDEQDPGGGEYGSDELTDRVLLRHGRQHGPADDHDRAGRDRVAVLADQL